MGHIELTMVCNECGEDSSLWVDESEATVGDPWQFDSGCPNCGHKYGEIVGDTRA